MTPAATPNTQRQPIVSAMVGTAMGYAETVSNAGSDEARSKVTQAATAAAVPTGTSDRICSGPSPNRRPAADAMPPPICTGSASPAASMIALITGWKWRWPTRRRPNRPAG